MTQNTTFFMIIYMLNQDLSLTEFFTLSAVVVLFVATKRKININVVTPAFNFNFETRISELSD